MSTYSIKDLEKLSGIKAHTIRIWEKRYALIEPARTGTNRRLYSDSDLRRIINVAILSREGIRISVLASLSNREIDERVALLSREKVKPEGQVESLIVAMIDLDEAALDTVLSGSIGRLGFEATFETIVFPFLRRVGLLWQTGSVNPALEHFITNILRNRIISAIDAIPRSERSDTTRRVLLFLPDNELHEIGLLYYAYLLKRDGHELLYLGQMMPLDALSEVTEHWRADMVVTGTITHSTISSPDDYVMSLSELFHGRRVLVSGLLADAAERLKLNNVFPVRSGNELTGLVNS